MAPDDIAGAGPVGGLLTALTVAGGPIVCVAWDMPFIAPGLLRRLAEGLAQADAVLPASAGRRGAEPLCAAYGPACAPAIQRRLAEGDRRVISFHQDVRVDILPPDMVATFGPPEFLFFNVNTDDDLTTAERLWAQHASSRS